MAENNSGSCQTEGLDWLDQECLIEVGAKLCRAVALQFDSPVWDIPVFCNVCQRRICCQHYTNVQDEKKWIIVSPHRFVTSAVTRLIASKIKDLVYIVCVYMYYAYINTHTCMYIFMKNMLYLYIKYIYNFNVRNINTCKYFQNICCMCVYLYIINIQYTHTHVYYIHINSYFGRHYSFD